VAHTSGVSGRDTQRIARFQHDGVALWERKCKCRWHEAFWTALRTQQWIMAVEWIDA
jgi:hypothetical protein